MGRTTQLLRPLLGVLLCQAAARAVVTTDGSLGTRASFSGSNVTLPASLGKQKGGNLFHSFGQFDVPSGGRVTFTGPASVKNVLARVTGGQASQINGTLASGIAGANLYLINPAGISFGSGSQLDVSGTFTATTADVIRLADDKSFAVDQSGDRVLTDATPAAFGFLSARPAAITIHDTTLTAPAARLIGGSVAMSNSAVYCNGGHLSVAAVRHGDLTFAPDTGDLRPAADTTAATVTLDGALLSADGDVGGRIDLHAADLTLTNGASISAETNAPGHGLGIDIALDGRLRAAGGSINAGTSGSGRSGDIAVRATAIALLDGSFIDADTGGSGAAGRVDINTQVLRVSGIDGDGNASYISSDSVSDTTGGAGGVVSVRARTIRLGDGGYLSSDTYGLGSGGSVAVKAHGLVLDGANDADVQTQISASSVNDAAGGAAGAVRLVADRVDVVNGAAIDAISDGNGRAGSIFINAHALSVRGLNAGGAFGSIAVDTQSEAADGGAAGRLNVSARDIQLNESGTLSADTLGGGPGGQIDLRTKSLSIDGAGSLSASTTASGAAGTLHVAAARLILLNGSAIQSLTTAAGDAGDVTVLSDRLTIDGGGGSSGFTGISSQANSSATGAAGQVLVTARELSVVADGNITSSTAGRGAAGSTTVHAGTLRIQGDLQSDFFTGIDSQSSGVASGPAGQVTVSATHLSISDGGQIGSNTYSAAPAGGVDVSARSLSIIGTNLKTFTGIASDCESAAAGNAGTVTVSAERMDVRHGGEITSSTFGSGAAGLVTVKASALSIDGSSLSGRFTGISSQTNPGATGTGGNVSVTADRVALINNGAISSATFSPAPAGTVSVAAGILTMRGNGLAGARALITSDSESGATGSAGNVSVTARQMTMTDGGEIGSGTYGKGDAGTVSVTARSLRIDEGAGRTFTGVDSQAEPAAAGSAGDIVVSGGSVDLLNGAEFSSRSFGSGTAGTVTVQCDTLHLGTDTAVTASSTTARAGGVTIDATREITANHSSISSSSDASDGGNIDLNAGRFVSLNHSTVTAQAGRNGARLSIDPQFVLLNNATVINGLAGGRPVRVRIDPRAILIRSPDSKILADQPVLPPDVDLTGALLHFVIPRFGGQTTLAAGCETELRKKNLSSFVAQERLGLPPVPGQAVMSGLALPR